MVANEVANIGTGVIKTGKIPKSILYFKLYINSIQNVTENQRAQLCFCFDQKHYWMIRVTLHMATHENNTICVALFC